MYHYLCAFLLTMHLEHIDRSARPLILGQLIDPRQSVDGVWLTTCGAIAQHHLTTQSTVMAGGI
ncbi:MAG: hypothetical protein AAGA75_12290 [Cyanobacteria bacterium P01_E01_bin.6]